MATLADLKPSITQLPREDAISLILKCRESRRTPKDPPKKKGSSTRSRSIKKVDVNALFTSLEKQQAERLLAKMGEICGQK